MPALSKALPHLATTPVAIKNILVAVDFEPASQKAFELGATLARLYDARLVLAHVRPILPAAPSEPEQFLYLNKVLQDRLQDMTSNPICDGLALKTVLAEGAVGDEIDRVVKEEHIDLLVIGTHGALGLEKLIMGSIAESLFRHCSVPVLTVGPHVKRFHTPFEHLLFATDLTGRCLRAAQYAASVAEENDAEITMLHVLGNEDAQNDRASIDARNEMELLLPEDASTWCKPMYRVEQGDAAEQILKLQREIGADLIVLAVTEPEKIMADHAPWSTASKVVRESTVPVLTVKNRL